MSFFCSNVDDLDKVTTGSVMGCKTTGCCCPDGTFCTSFDESGNSVRGGERDRS